jgi:division protein CdvB (Snf7/Vps24/ESCRT-III family)
LIDFKIEDVANFEQSWSPKPTVGITEKIGGIVHNEGPLKPRVEGATRKLSQPIDKLDYMAKKLDQKDTKLFQRIVEAKQSHNNRQAKVLANELAELRKHRKVIGNMKISIEQVKMRLTTINELGDVMYALGPAMSTMKALGPALSKFIPEADAEFTAMGNALGGLMANSFEGSFEGSFGSNEETELILQEASAVAGTKIGDKFPTVPVSVGSGLTSSADQY